MPTNSATLRLYYSGGATNSDPLLSLGGEISNTPVSGQTFSTVAGITGITVEYANDNKLGNHDLVYDATNNTVTWGLGESVEITISGKYAVYNEAYEYDYTYHPVLYLDINTNQLPLTNQTATYLIEPAKNILIPDFPAEWKWQNKDVYLCFYAKNIGTVNKHQVIAAAAINPRQVDINFGRYNDVSLYKNNTVAAIAPDIHTEPANIDWAAVDMLTGATATTEVNGTTAYDDTFDPNVGPFFDYFGNPVPTPEYWYNRLPPDSFFHFWVCVSYDVAPLPDLLDTLHFRLYGFDE